MGCGSCDEQESAELAKVIVVAAIVLSEGLGTMEVRSLQLLFDGLGLEPAFYLCWQLYGILSPVNLSISQMPHYFSYLLFLTRFGVSDISSRDQAGTIQLG
jgi:hypothetical protein